jgi:hypothetical protein
MKGNEDGQRRLRSPHRGKVRTVTYGDFQRVEKLRPSSGFLSRLEWRLMPASRLAGDYDGRKSRGSRTQRSSTRRCGRLAGSACPLAPLNSCLPKSWLSAAGSAGPRLTGREQHDCTSLLLPFRQLGFPYRRASRAPSLRNALSNVLGADQKIGSSGCNHRDTSSVRPLPETNGGIHHA